MALHMPFHVACGGGSGFHRTVAQNRSTCGRNGALRRRRGPCSRRRERAHLQVRQAVGGRDDGAVTAALDHVRRHLEAVAPQQRELAAVLPQPADAEEEDDPRMLTRRDSPDQDPPRRWPADASAPWIGVGFLVGASFCFLLLSCSYILAPTT